MAFMAQKPEIPSGTIVDSLPPAKMTLASPIFMVRQASPTAWAEVAHAINRVKWGIWDCGDYRRLVAPVARLAERFPAVRFTGPAVIDFEYPFVVSALGALPRGLRFHAVSHHLYVDRRGAPENPQAGFSLLEKCAMGRAIARWSPATEDRFIVSEVNWPLLGTGAKLLYDGLTRL